MSTCRDTTAILEPFKAFVTRILFSRIQNLCGMSNSRWMLNCRIKSECGSIQRQLFDEFFAKWVTILALIEDMNDIEVLHDGDTRSGIQDDPEMMQMSQPP